MHVLIIKSALESTIYDSTMSSALKIFVVSPDIRAERRIEPYWTVQLLKVRFCLLYESAIDAIPKG